jgi:hypothetical protein
MFLIKKIYKENLLNKQNYYPLTHPLIPALTGRGEFNEMEGIRPPSSGAATDAQLYLYFSIYPITNG